LLLSAMMVVVYWDKLRMVPSKVDLCEQPTHRQPTTAAPPQ